MWDRFFDLDNVVWRTIDKIGKIFLLNLLWLICSLPVFTIGASTTALIYTSMKLSDNEGSGIRIFSRRLRRTLNRRRRCFLFIWQRVHSWRATSCWAVVPAIPSGS